MDDAVVKEDEPVDEAADDAVASQSNPRHFDPKEDESVNRGI